MKQRQVLIRNNVSITTNFIHTDVTNVSLGTAGGTAPLLGVQAQTECEELFWPKQVNAHGSVLN